MTRKRKGWDERRIENDAMWNEGIWVDANKYCQVQFCTSTDNLTWILNEVSLPFPSSSVSYWSGAPWPAARRPAPELAARRLWAARRRAPTPAARRPKAAARRPRSPRPPALRLAGAHTGGAEALLERLPSGALLERALQHPELLVGARHRLRPLLLALAPEQHPLPRGPHLGIVGCSGAPWPAARRSRAPSPGRGGRGLANQLRGGRECHGRGARRLWAQRPAMRRPGAPRLTARRRGVGLPGRRPGGRERHGRRPERRHVPAGGSKHVMAEGTVEE
ncbi:hypothetical protein GQ55_4G109500 [Panicum hallii var. hallii]|uniref:Uncharacterized protein n=1 Tax=Panicum hallii var. hallii TaxID=1504633 RepID=A0A2T7DXF6_9POAL|nr:hypothetical protein GQ55_4G109500 [Panicum hallii var. hallii]